MNRVYFCAGNSFVTGDEIAEALVQYVLAVAERDHRDVVTIPVRHEDGSPGRATLLLTATSQIAAQSLPRDGDEMVDAAVVRDLRGRIAALTAPRLPDAVEPERPAFDLLFDV